MVPYGLFKHPCVICLSFPYFSLNYSLTQVEYIPLSSLQMQLRPIIPSLQFFFLSPSWSFYTFLSYVVIPGYINKAKSQEPRFANKREQVTSIFLGLGYRLNVTLSGSNHLPATITISFFFTVEQNSIGYVCYIFTIHLSLEFV